MAVCYVSADGPFLEDDAQDDAQRFGGPHLGLGGNEHRPGVQIYGGGSRYPPNYPGGSGYPPIGTGHLPIENSGYGYSGHGSHGSHGSHGNHGNYDSYGNHGHHGNHGHRRNDDNYGHRDNYRHEDD